MKLCEIFSEEDRKKTEAFGMKIVDEVTIGDYTIGLIRCNTRNGSFHQVALAKKGTNFTDFAKQTQKFVTAGEQFPLSKFPLFIDALKGWVDKYQRIYVGSASEAKRDTYERIITRRLPNYSIIKIEHFNGGKNVLCIMKKIEHARLV